MLSTNEVSAELLRLHRDRRLTEQNENASRRRQAVAVDAVTLDTLVGGRFGLIYRCYQTEDMIKLRCHSTEIAFPRRAAMAVVHALETRRFPVRDLPGNLDDDSKLVLIRRLIQESLVMTV